MDEEMLLDVEELSGSSFQGEVGTIGILDSQELRDCLVEMAACEIKAQFHLPLIVKPILQRLFKLYDIIKRESQQLLSNLKNSLDSQIYQIVPAPFLLANTLLAILHFQQQQGQIPSIIYPPGLTSIQLMSLRLLLQKGVKIESCLQPTCEKLALLVTQGRIMEEFVTKAAQIYAPNVSQIAGNHLTGKLLCEAGGLAKLAALPAGNIQVMGALKSRLVKQVGDALGLQNNGGLFIEHEEVKKASPQYKMRVIRMLATNVAKMAKIDQAGTDPTGYTGAKCMQALFKRYEAIIADQDPVQLKPLPPIIEQPKKRRGGKRFRKRRQQNAQSELRKLQSRLAFGQAEEEVNPGEGLGMIGKKIGKVKVDKKEQKIKPSKKLASRLLNEQRRGGGISNLQVRSGKQMVLLQPESIIPSSSLIKRDYFQPSAGFTTIMNNKRP